MTVRAFAPFMCIVIDYTIKKPYKTSYLFNKKFNNRQKVMYYSKGMLGFVLSTYPK